MASTRWMQKEREISTRLVLAAIGDTGATRKQICVATGLHSSTFIRILKVLRDEKRVRIGAWINRRDELTGERKPGTPFAVYAMGSEPDAPRPRQLSKRKVQAKWQRKQRAVIRAKTLAREGKANMFDQLRYAA